MLQKLAGLALCAALALPAAADAVDDYVRGVMAKKKIPGVSLVVVRKGQIVKAEGYGYANVELDAKATADTIYQSGSTGKQFTAAGILLLAEDGKLSLDDRLSKHFPDGPAWWHRITLRHLLTHTSGLKDYGADEFDFRKDYDEQAQLKAMKTVPLEFEPGTQWSYSNTGYLILGLLTSKLAGKHWGEFQAERIFAPLGMQTTRVISEKDIVKNRAAGYELDDKGELKNQDWVAPSLNTCADGALYFSVRDLAAWEAGLYAGKFLKPASLAAWWTPVTLANGTTYQYGFGWDVAEQRGQKLIEHGGSWQGFRAAITRYVDQGLAVAVLTNLSSAEPETMAHEIAGLLEPAVALPDPAAAKADPDPTRAAKLRGVLEAWGNSRVVPAMAKAVAETASGSGREAYGRNSTDRYVKALSSFTYLGEDDLSTKPLAWRGESVVKIVHYALATKDSRYAYRFYLTKDGRVADFGSEER
jgi:CubicO group peptidase (beta-lactamase class C family)